MLLALTASASADYYRGFTHVTVQPKLGRIEISRGMVRDQKYVDRMCDNREELVSDGIYPDADPGKKIENLHTIEMEDQVFEVKVISNWTQTYGRAGAAPYNHLQIKIDGVLRYDISFGEHPNLYTTTVRIEILPIDKMIYRDGIKQVSSYSGCEHKWMWIQGNSIRFYDDAPEDWFVDNGVINKCWSSNLDVDKPVQISKSAPPSE